MNKTPTTLIIMDGFGLRSEKQGNAVANARTPVLDGLFETCAHTTLSASGLDVGLPAGQMGNSEVGHTNIGGGRVVYQDLPRISRAIEDGSFFENSAYCAAMDAAKEKGSSLHLYGLLSELPFFPSQSDILPAFSDPSDWVSCESFPDSPAFRSPRWLTLAEFPASQSAPSV